MKFPVLVALLIFCVRSDLSHAYTEQPETIFSAPIPFSEETNDPDVEPLLQSCIVKSVTESGAGWKASTFQPRFQDYTVKEAKRMLMADVPDEENGNTTHILPLKLVQLPPDVQLPEEFDAREKWFDCESVTMIRDQGNCGSCWAFGVIGTMSDRTCIGTKGRDQAILSAIDLMSCCKNCTGGRDACQGGFPDEAYAYWNNTGLVTGGNWMTKIGCKPYPVPISLHHSTLYQKAPQCANECTEDSFRLPYAQDKRRAVDVYRLRPRSPRDMQTEVMLHGPISVSFKVYQDFFLYQTGVYQHVIGPLLGGHQVRIVGWGVENGTEYWTVANSWNTIWGAHGFFKIRRGTNECGIENSPMAGQVDPSWKPSWEGPTQ